MLASAVVYHPVTRAYFFADDFVALFALSNGTGSEWVTSSTGGHLYVVRNLVMALIWNIAGVDPRAYFWVGLAAHLAVVAGLFAVVFGSTGRALLAAVVATLWGTCPMSVGTLSWIAAHGHAFAALALVVALTGMLTCSRGDDPVGGWLVLGWGALLIVGALSFGTGIAVALLYPVLLALLVPRERLGRSACTIALAVPLVTIALYRGVSSGETANADRLIELTGQLGRVGVFFGHLLGSGASSLILGPSWSRDAYPDVTTIGVAVMVGAVLLAGFVGGTWRTRRALAALLLVTAGTYGAIAAARAGFYHFFAARQPNPLAFGATMARYHYEAQLALAAALGIALGPLLERVRLPSSMETALGAVVLTGIVGASLLRPPSIPDYDATRKAAALFIRGIRTRAERASGPVVSIPNRPWHGAGPFIDVRPDCFPGLAGAFVVYFPTDVVAGREVRFVTDDERTLAARNGGGRITRLLLTPDANDVGSLRP